MYYCIAHVQAVFTCWRVSGQGGEAVATRRCERGGAYVGRSRAQFIRELFGFLNQLFCPLSVVGLHRCSSPEFLVATICVCVYMWQLLLLVNNV